MGRDGAAVRIGGERQGLERKLQSLSDDRCAHMKQTYLTGQMLLPVGAPVGDLLDRDAMLRWLRDWITSYLTSEARQALVQPSS